MQSRQSTDANLRRAVRYAIVAPVRYRTCADVDWLDASTVNMGQGGILIKTRHATPPLATAVEMRVSLVAGYHAGSDVACSGHVVRVGHLPTGDVLLAMTIDAYRFERRALISPSRGSTGHEQTTVPDSETVARRSRQES